MRRTSASAAMLFLVLSMLLAGCGGGGTGDGGTGGSGSGSSSKTVTLTFGIVSTASLPVPIMGTVETVIVPQGVTVSSEPSGLNGVEAQVSFSSSDRRLRVVAVNATGIGLGDFAQITCTVNAGVSLSASDFTLLYNAPDFTTSGLDGGNTVNLTSSTRPTLTVTGL